MNIVVFDTETANLEKPFAYNIGYAICDTDTAEVLVKRDFVAEQVWHNEMLFTTAYYANKRPLYVERMRARKTVMDKYGYICRQMAKDFRDHAVQVAFAFNSPFDDRVFQYNCEWFHCLNPFDNIPIFDIRGYVHEFLVTPDFLAFCDKHGYYTESGNYSTTAETMFRYLSDNTDFEEEHTALADSEIELAILLKCLEAGADIMGDYKPKRSITKAVTKTLTVTVDGKEVLTADYSKISINKDKTKISLR